MRFASIPDRSKHFIAYHPVNQKFSGERLRAHEKRVVLDYGVQVFYAGYTSFQVCRSKTFVGKLKSEYFGLFISLFFNHKAAADLIDGLYNGVNLLLPHVSEALIGCVEKAGLDCLGYKSAFFSDELFVEN